MTTRIRSFDLSEKEVLAKQWKNLESRANCSMFLSWLWIGQWLELVVDDMFVIEAYQNEQVVGLGIFVEKERKVFGLYPIKQWFMHRTGNIKQDQIWIEYNDFLLAADIADDVRSLMVKALYNHTSEFKEIIVGLSSKKVLNCFHQIFPQSSILIESSGYAVDYSFIENNYLQEVLSKNARSQINRSNKILNQLGDLAFKVVTKTDEINLFYKDIAIIHMERWGNTEEGSGFSNKVFVDFHSQLINNDETNIVQISVLLLNNSPIGYLVNYVYKQKVYFYLSAFTTFSNNKIKVGLTLHEKAIDFYEKKGMKAYDFLAGEARYKRSLSNKSYELGLYSFYKTDLFLVIERKLKYLKNKIFLHNSQR
jgi:CelD/BcsL family acetyltransferase involved in cellulose biosynthesis